MSLAAARVGTCWVRLLLAAAYGYLQLLNAARIALCHAGGPRYARLLAPPGWAKRIARVSHERASFARGCSWLLEAANRCLRLLEAYRELASTVPHVTRPQNTSLVHRPASRGLARRRDSFLADSGTGSRRHRYKAPTPRRSANGATFEPRHRHVGDSALPRWFLDVILLTSRRCRACASASPRLCLGSDDIFALAQRRCHAGECRHILEYTN